MHWLAVPALLASAATFAEAQPVTVSSARAECSRSTGAPGEVAEDGAGQNSPFTELIMNAPKADHVLPAFHPLLLDEPVPEGGRLKVSALDKPGFGVRLNPASRLHRPYTH